MQSKVRYLILPERKIVEASQGQTILESALKAKVPLDHTCGGFGTCGTCRVKVVEGLEKLGPRGELEAEIAQDRGFKPEERLACQNEAREGLVLERPQRSKKLTDE
ncbi:MAG: (2Fe-2S)-binding protein [Bdellovibrionaceae bacterium]|nr:(2Fe-2S)-binding protein [Pseudobdellovibrionaceae bacterium]